MSKLRIYDAHHHLWALDHCRYPWLMAKGVRRFFGDPAPIQKDYGVAEFLADAADYELAGSTHIQVGVAAEDAVRETRWLQSLSDQARRLPTAIVGYADLTADNLERQLDAHQQSGAFRGVRQIIGRHPVEDARTGSAALLDNPRFAEGLKLLERRRLSFDLQLTEAQYARALEVFAARPGLRVAICHFASPWDLSPSGFQRWRRALAGFAALPNCWLKFSGFGMFKPDWTAADIAPYVETALELFGEGRCMAGSNFPVDKLHGGYGRIWAALEDLISGRDALADIGCDNAARFYGAPLQ